MVVFGYPYFNSNYRDYILYRTKQVIYQKRLLKIKNQGSNLGIYSYLSSRNPPFQKYRELSVIIKGG
jgi:hypothetical protein